MPPLSQRVSIEDYAEKLAERAVNLVAFNGFCDQGHAAIYVNDAGGGTAFISSICVLPKYRRDGIAASLLEGCLGEARLHAMREVRLEVERSNSRAIAFYLRHGFEFSISGAEGSEAGGETIFMQRRMGSVVSS